MTHICVGKLTIIGSDNGLSPERRQAIIWTNAGILLIEPLGTNFSEILIKSPTFSFKKMCLKESTAKWQPFCLGLNELKPDQHVWLVSVPHDICEDWYEKVRKGACYFTLPLDHENNIFEIKYMHIYSDCSTHSHMIWLLFLNSVKVL